MNKDEFLQIVINTINEILDDMKDKLSPMVLVAVSATFVLLAKELTNKLYPDDETKIEIER